MDTTFMGGIPIAHLQIIQYFVNIFFAQGIEAESEGKARGLERKARPYDGSHTDVPPIPSFR